MGLYGFVKRSTYRRTGVENQLKLRLSMIDDEDITYFNGVEIARGYGYNSPREYIVPAEVVKSG